MSKFYLYNDKVYIEDKKGLRFIPISNPKEIVKFVDLSPDEAEKFIEIKPNENSQHSKSAPEKLYKIVTDLKTVFFLTPDSFENICKQVNKYLMEIEDFERMAVVRDICIFFKNKMEKIKIEVDDIIKGYEKNK